jgi:hypothetical protein
MVRVTLVQGEAKTLPFMIRNRVTGKAENLTAARFILWAKADPDDEYATLWKSETDFDTSGAAAGFVSLFLTADDTYLPPRVYQAELRVTLNGTPHPIEKLRFEIEIVAAVTPTDLNTGITGIVSLEAVGAPTIT